MTKVDMHKDKCETCSADKHLVYQGKRTRKDNTVKIRYKCRECNYKKMKKYRGTENGAVKTRANIYKSQKKFMQKHLARLRIYYAVRTGKLKRPNTCSVCMEIKKIEGHHEDYLKPLEVIWVCRGCHIELDKKLKK